MRDCDDTADPRAPKQESVIRRPNRGRSARQENASERYRYGARQWAPAKKRHQVVGPFRMRPISSDRGECYARRYPALFRLSGGRRRQRGALLDIIKSGAFNIELRTPRGGFGCEARWFYHHARPFSGPGGKFTDPCVTGVARL